MAARLDRAVRLNAVDGIWAEVDGVSVANVGLPGFTDLPDESQCSLGVGYGESCSPTCLDFIANNAEHRRDVVQAAGVQTGSPLGDLVFLAGGGFPPPAC